MNICEFRFCDTQLTALPSGALYWQNEGLLVVSDLHFGKSARLSAVGGAQLPPYECRETMLKLEVDLERCGATKVICLGDSFDAPEIAEALPEAERLWLIRLMAGRDWIWIEGNHDPGPISLGGTHLAEVTLGRLTFRHIAMETSGKMLGEVTGHYHPKARIKHISRPCFLYDGNRLILPAYGTFTGGLRTDSTELTALMAPNARAILTGARALEIPMPR